MSLESWGSFVQLARAARSPVPPTSCRFRSKRSARGSPRSSASWDASFWSRGSAALTRAGEAFFSYAREQEAARTRMLRQVSEVTIGGSGELKVGISNMRGRVLMPHVIRQFHSSLPNVRIKLMEGTNEELIELAEHGEADVVVACFGSGHPGSR